MVKKKIVWDKLARASLKEVYDYIKRDSLLQAEKVKQEIIAASKRLADYPEMHPPD
jgi:plasmid stabilization system protein ParE